MNRSRVAILSAVRTPIGKFLGSLSEISAVDLGAAAAREAIARSGLLPSEIGETVFGQARQAGNAPNPGRQISVKAGLSFGVPASTINQACASGLRAIQLAVQSIRAGDAEAVLAGGVESMSRVPFLLEGLRKGWKMGHQPLVDDMYRDGFTCGLCGRIMGETAETLAAQYGIPREEQDAYALRSQNRAEAAQKAGLFEEEIIPIEVPGRGGPTVFDSDEHVRHGATSAELARLPAVFSKTGTVTAGNASGITDGAAALVLASEDLVRRRKLDVLAWYEDGVVVGVDPEIMGIGPVPAVRALLDRTGTALGGYDLLELNEAFAAQVLAVDRDLKFDPDRLNVNGGSIALGHPIGASGARIVVTLLHEMRRRGARRGLATLCVSGGLGIASSFQRD
ncbi:MAG: acetyl-CoA C-acyltransferase [Candidatus Eisenbacteria bacterium]|nr:acetyl-CoA C-acyltransferase [Candidatus Eisenbacteria bacterium]